MLNDSLPYFDFQRVINAQWYGARSHLGIEDLHYLLTQSRLTTTALWLMGSNSDIQRIVSAADPQALSNPAVQFQIGVRFISERNYAAAVEPLIRAEQNPELRDEAFRFRIYALCMSGQTDQAQHLAQVRLAQLLKEKNLTAGSIKETDLPPFWGWMKKTFGINPLTGV
jgi:hypothetical protein